MTKQEYVEKLKDPRWQKKRLEILQRDDFCCQLCFDSESVLHIHHRRYIADSDPWDVPDSALITLCETCHESEQTHLKMCCDTLLTFVRDKYFSASIEELANTLQALPITHTDEVTMSIIAWNIRNNWNNMYHSYFNDLLEKRKNAST